MEDNLSYLNARDPSILAWNRVQRPKKNLEQDFLEEEPELQEDSNLLEVYLRIKNNENLNNLYSIEDNTIYCNNISGHVKSRRKFTFTKIFDYGTSQIEIFNDVVKCRVLNFINGISSTIMTYGASGSGKTFTIVGTEDDPGLIPRTLEYLFRTTDSLIKSTPYLKPMVNRRLEELNKTQQLVEIRKCRHLLENAFNVSDKFVHQKTYRAMKERLSTEPVATVPDSKDICVDIYISFAEIYNDMIYDLLSPTALEPNRERLRLGGCNANFYIRDLTEVHVTCGDDAYQLLQLGKHRLKYAATAVNPNSSRSHFIFTIKLIQYSTHSRNKALLSSFSFCDLAGAERLNKTGNVGNRLKESNNINMSLCVLGRCIEAIRNRQQNPDQFKPPFRESKLTQLFQRPLMGHEDLAFVVNINPSQEMVGETIHVLNFSSVASDITTDLNQLVKQEEIGSYIETEEIYDLNAQLVEIVEVNECLRNLVIEKTGRLEKRLEESTLLKKKLSDLKTKLHELYTYDQNESEVLSLDESSDDDEELAESLGNSFADENERPLELEINKEKANLLKDEIKLLRSNNRKLSTRVLTLADTLKDKDDMVDNLIHHIGRMSRHMDYYDVHLSDHECSTDSSRASSPGNLRDCD